MSKNKNVSDSDTNNPAAETENAAVNTGRYEGVTNFAYIGPSLPGGRLKSNTVLCGTYAEITEYYKEAIELYPSAARLIVPVARLAESREKIKTSGNLLYNYNEEIAAAIKTKGVEE